MNNVEHTLRDWGNAKDAPGFPYFAYRNDDRLEWDLRAYDQKPHSHLEFEFDSFRYYPQAWDPFIEPRKQFKDRFMERFEKQLEAYLDKVDDIIEKKNVIPTPEKRNLEHFVWTVLYQVLGLNYQRIADRYAEGGNLDQESVRDAVRKTAEFINIRLRPPKRGRPRKN